MDQLDQFAALVVMVRIGDLIEQSRPGRDQFRTGRVLQITENSEGDSPVVHDGCPTEERSPLQCQTQTTVDDVLASLAVFEHEPIVELANDLQRVTLIRALSA